MKLTADVHRAIVQSIAGGAFATTAAHAAGVSKATYFRWLQRGRQATERAEQGADVPLSEAPFQAFYEDVSQADANVEIAVASILYQAARAGDWRAGAWLLERRFPDQWGQRADVRHSADSKLTAVLASSIILDDIQPDDTDTPPELTARPNPDEETPDA